MASLAGGDKLLVFSESLEGALRAPPLRLLLQPSTGALALSTTAAHAGQRKVWKQKSPGCQDAGSQAACCCVAPQHDQARRLHVGPRSRV